MAEKQRKEAGRPKAEERKPKAEEKRPAAKPPREGEPADPSLPAGALRGLELPPIGHDDPILAIAHSGKMIATGAADGTIILWDASSRQPVHRLTGHKDRVTHVAFSPDGRLIVSAGEDMWIRLWDTMAGKEQIKLGGGKLSFWSLAFSTDGKHLAYGTTRGDIGLYNIRAKETEFVLRGHSKHVRALAFSPDGKHLASVGELPAQGKQASQGVLLWDMVTRKQVFAVKVRADALAFSPDGKSLALGGHDGSVRLLNAATGNEMWNLPVTFSRDIDAGSVRKLIAQLSANSPKEREEARRELHRLGPDIEPELLALQGKPDSYVKEQVADILGDLSPLIRPVQGVSFSPDGSALAFSYHHGRVRVCDPHTGKLKASFRTNTFSLAPLAWSPDGKIIATTGPDNSAYLWDGNGGKSLQGEQGTGGRVQSAVFSPDGRMIVTSSGEVVRFWDAATGKCLRSLPGFPSMAALSADGRVLAAAGTRLFLWHFPDSDRPRTCTLRDRVVSALALSPDGALLAYAPLDGNIHLWDNIAEKPLWHIPRSGLVQSLAFSPDGKRLAATEGGSRVTIWDVSTGRAVDIQGENRVRFRAVAYSPDGRLLATANSDGVRMWETARGTLLRQARKGDTTSVAFSPDGKMLASGGADGAVTLWETATGKERVTYRGHNKEVTAVNFAPNGRQLISGSADGTALVWRVSGPDPKVRPRPPVAAELPGLWNDLSAGDAAKAYAALERLAKAPERAAPFLRSHLRPVVADRRRVTQRITDLDHDEYAVRQDACAELELIGRQARPALRKALAGKPSPEARRRMEALLDAMLVEQLEGVLPPEQVRFLRAVEVLERIGTPEARKALAALAGGAAASPLTLEAKAALQRLERR